MIREGTDITLVGWGAQLSVMEQACVDAEKVKVSCMDSINLLTLKDSELMIKYHENQNNI